MTKISTFHEKNKGEITQEKLKKGLWFLSSALPLINIYVYVSSLISIPFVLSKIWPGQASIMKNG